VQRLTLLTFKVATQFFVQGMWSRLERLSLDFFVSRRSRDLPKVSSRSRLRQVCQRLGLGLGLGLEGQVHIPNIYVYVYVYIACTAGLLLWLSVSVRHVSGMFCRVGKSYFLIDLNVASM
jgi:hypothetical protein